VPSLRVARNAQGGVSVRVLAVTAALALVLAGCGSSDDDEQQTAAVSTTTGTRAANTAGLDRKRAKDLAGLLDNIGYGPKDSRDYVDEVRVKGDNVDVFVNLAPGEETRDSFYGLCSALMDTRPWMERVWLTGSTGKIAAAWYRGDDDCEVKD
jgi:hypothetical protein